MFKGTWSYHKNVLNAIEKCKSTIEVYILSPQLAQVFDAISMFCSFFEDPITNYKAKVWSPIYHLLAYMGRWI